MSSFFSGLSMKWLKSILLDVAATLVIAIVVFFDETALLEYVVYVYTGLLAIARLLTLFSSDMRSITKRSVTEAPILVYHLLYFLNVAFLIYGSFYFTGIVWAFIWGVATYVHTKHSS